MKKRLFVTSLAVLSVLVAICLSGCGGGGGTSAVAPVSIAVTPTGYTLGVGASEHFVATATNSDGSTSVITLAVVWTSSDTEVATVNDSTDPGLVTGVAAGSATITATEGSISGSTTVTVQGQ